MCRILKDNPPQLRLCCHKCITEWGDTHSNIWRNNLHDPTHEILRGSKLWTRSNIWSLNIYALPSILRDHCWLMFVNIWTRWKFGCNINTINIFKLLFKLTKKTEKEGEVRNLTITCYMRSIIASSCTVIWPCHCNKLEETDFRIIKKIPNKVNIYGAHCASEDYPVSPLRIINSLIEKGDLRWEKCNWYLLTSI